MRVFEIKLRDGEEHFTTSIVKDPAIEQKLTYFSADKPVFFANDEKRVIYAVAMRPNKLIFRSEVDGEPGYVYYTPETVELFQQKYAKHLGQKLTNINHSADYVNDVYPIENWIVKDKNNDKTNVIGMSAENGDLIMGFKVENDKVWEDCKSGKLDGLSIEAYFDNYEKEEKNMKKVSFWDHVKNTIKKFAEDNAGKTISVDGKEWNVTDLAIDGVVSDADGNPLADGEFDFEGKVYKTNNLGVITEIEPVEAEEMAEDVKPEDEPKEEMAEDEEEMAEDEEALKKENEDLKAKIADLEKQIQDEKSAKVEAETKLETMKKQTPKAVEVNRNPVFMKKDPSEMTNFEKYKLNRGKL